MSLYCFTAGLKVKVTQKCSTLCDPMDCTVHGILQARLLEWVAYSLLQWVFLTQKPNQGLLHGRPILYQLRYQGSLSDNHCSILCIYVFVFCFI